ncbi:MAG: peptide chain release factor-like protein [Candidatus Eisenbacteria bacterium]|uniref:Peptide chain release factor-like protein n=1 Tax=Eiseniibacteriota bacterium TaxID=2212470 RepID=A0A948W827_UNCEI|nr:peptide chain release factor-like protein [Candidatus Eisenbacteria bacterium]MBU1950888.1 peptide chain release factor-like protein [Candidatus Eisenbacteria bacterium]MBU2692860.1 peptide chain release factor-like protein [Candidatus Eisenbacteria bacterium]
MATTRDNILKECRITVFRSGGPGGQKRNKVASAVRIQHIPTGVVAIGRCHRELHRNRKEAEDRLVEKVLALEKKPPARHPTQPTAAAREERLTGKKQRSRLKEMRNRVIRENEGEGR